MALHVCDEAWVCQECMVFLVIGDLSGVEDDERAEEIEQAAAAFPTNAVPEFEEYGEGHNEFSARACGCCATGLAGSRYRFQLLMRHDTCTDACPGPWGAL